MGWDAHDYFDRSFLQSDGEAITGNPDPVSVHVALRDGKEIAPELGHRLLAICHSHEEYIGAWERLRGAFDLINPLRRAAIRTLRWGPSRDSEPNASSMTESIEDIEEIQRYRSSLDAILALFGHDPRATECLNDPDFGETVRQAVERDRHLVAELVVAATQMLRGGAHDGPCDNEDFPDEGCDLHWDTAAGRRNRMRQALDAFLITDPSRADT